MTLAKLIGVALYNAVLNSGSKTLTWKAVQEWINQNSNPDKMNRGFASFSPWTGSSTGNRFVELRKVSKGNKIYKVTVSVYFNKKQGAAASKTWDATKLDSELQKMFGKNLRTTIQI